jgi:hypothetical protein
MNLIENIIKKYFQKQKEKKQAKEKLQKVVTILNKNYGDKTYTFNTKDGKDDIDYNEYGAGLNDPGLIQLLDINIEGSFSLNFVYFDDAVWVTLHTEDSMIWSWKDVVAKQIHNMTKRGGIEEFNLMFSNNGAVFHYANGNLRYVKNIKQK